MLAGAQFVQIWNTCSAATHSKDGPRNINLEKGQLDSPLLLHGPVLTLHWLEGPAVHLVGD